MTTQDHINRINGEIAMLEQDIRNKRAELAPYIAQKEREDVVKRYLDRVEREAELKRTTVHLQGIGKHPAIPASGLQVGDKRVYNYGHTAEIVSVTLRPKGRWVDIETVENGVTYQQSHKYDTLIPVIRK